MRLQTLFHAGRELTSPMLIVNRPRVMKTQHSFNGNYTNVCWIKTLKEARWYFHFMNRQIYKNNFWGKSLNASNLNLKTHKKLKSYVRTVTTALTIDEHKNFKTNSLKKHTCWSYLSMKKTISSRKKTQIWIV